MLAAGCVNTASKRNKETEMTLLFIPGLLLEVEAFGVQCCD